MPLSMYTNASVTNNYEPVMLDSNSPTNNLSGKVDDLEKYVNYLTEQTNKLYQEKEEIIKKQEIFMIFYLNVDGYSRQQADDVIRKFIVNHNNIITDSFNINQIVLPVKNQPTKVEIVNPLLVNGDIIQSFKNLVDSLDDDKYKKLIEEL